MIIIHTSDWHLGQIFYGSSRLNEQVRFINWLKIVLLSIKAGAIIVAGDVYDSARPSYEAQRLLADFLAFCADNEIHAIITAGNHDSAECLAINKNLASSTKFVHIVSYDDEIIHLNHVTIAAAPFLTALKIEDLDQISAFSIEHFKALAKRARGDEFLIGVGHLATSADAQDAENAIYIGKSAAVDIKQLDMFDYFAMGHIHKASGTAIRYSGSPLAMSFKEANAQKSISVISVGEELDLAQGRELKNGAYLYTINVPKFVNLIELNAKNIDNCSLDEIGSNCYVKVNLEQINEQEILDLYKKAREKNIQISCVEKIRQEKEQIKERLIDELCPKIVLADYLKSQGKELSKDLENELKRLEIKAKNELASKEVDCENRADLY